MGKSSHAPDPYATAAAQTQSNKETANYNAALNRVDQYTPFGSSVYSVTGTGADGAPQYRNDVTLTPLAQQQLDNQLKQNAALSDLGFNLGDQAKTLYEVDAGSQWLPGSELGFLVDVGDPAMPDALALFEAVQAADDQALLTGVQGVLDVDEWLRYCAIEAAANVNC